MNRIKLLVTDVDNTLFDWFDVWHRSFSALVEETERISGVPRETLLAESKVVHQRYGTSEYTFLLQELPSLRALHQGDEDEILHVYDEALHAFRAARRDSLRLYDGVMQTLLELKRRGVFIVAYTESMGFYTADRIRRLELDGVLDILYCQADHDLPPGISLDKYRRYPADHYELQQTRLRHTPRGEVKPSPRILASVISDVGGSSAKTAYIGDDLAKDVLMAQRANVLDVHAKYGQSHSKEEYALLVAVTHWTDEQVETQAKLKDEEVNASVVLSNGFDEILNVVNFESFESGA